MCSFTRDETIDLETHRLGIEALAAVLRNHPSPKYECPDFVYRELIGTGIRPSFIGQHWDRIIKRANEMRAADAVANAARPGR